MMSMSAAWMSWVPLKFGLAKGLIREDEGGEAWELAHSLN